jgi:hypothetical protein
MDHSVRQNTEEVMNQPQPQQPQQVSSQRAVPAHPLAASMNGMRTAAFSLLVDRALSA